MKRYFIEKCEREFKLKGFEYSPFCTYGEGDIFNEQISPDFETKEEAKNIIENNISYLNAVADAVLESEGFDYQGKTRIATEKFPTRVYDDITLPAGEYEAVILDLGSGEGDNWWCLVYPAFCFTKSENSTNYVYISKIWEIINSVT